MLQVGPAGHRDAEVTGRLVEEGVDDVEHQPRDGPGLWRRYRRNRVTTWSLRERPARSRPPTSAPARSMRPRSSAVWTSSSEGSGPNTPLATSASSRSSASSIAASAASSSSRRRGGPARGLGNRRCRGARGASRSGCSATAGERVGRATGEAATPEADPAVGGRVRVARSFACAPGRVELPHEAAGGGRGGADDEDRVVAGDRAEDVGEVRLVDAGREVVRGAGRRAQDDLVAGAR